MTWFRVGTAGILTMMATPMLAALPADDLALWESVRIRQVRPLARTTDLVRERTAAARIVAPVEQPWRGAAERIRDAVHAATGVRLPVVADTDITDADWTAGNHILIGNLLVSPAYARLYHNFFVCADAGYTGTDGYELRSVHEPFGPGGNVIALGAQAEGGLLKGVARLAELVTQEGTPGALTLGRILEVDLQAAGARAAVPTPLTPARIESGKRVHDDIYARTGTERAAPQRAISDAMSYHRTADEGYLELYRYGIMSHMRYYAENEYINSEGLGRYDREFRDSWTWKLVVTWDLLEDHPTWTEDERLQITNHLLRCVLECNVYQNWMSQERIEEWRRFDSITHNHHTWPGLANLFGGWYFKRHYGHRLADNWLTIAQGMFRSCSKSSKPWEDSAGYQWIPMGHILTYAYASGDMTYIREGHADLTGHVALMCMDSLGHQPAFGDHSSFTSNSRLPTMFSALEYATRDGRYRWALEWLGATSGGELDEPYYTEVQPRRPDDHIGVAVAYLPKPHFDLNGLNPQYFPTANIPFAESFDKLTLRAGWEQTDDYLMLDGYSGGSHGHQDCNAIIGYTAAGKHWLVDGEYIRQTPKYHCAVTVVRDGVSVRNPAMARLDDAAWFEDGALCRTTIPDYNGVSWSRYLFWRPNGWVAVVDRLTALVPGDYSLRSCWRVYGDAELTADRLHLRQEEAGFVLQNLSGDALELVHVKDVGSLPVHHLYQRRSQRLAAGESLSFVNVFAAQTAGLPEIEGFLCADERFAVRAGGGLTVMGTGSLQHGDVSVDAAAWMLDAERLRLASARRCAAAGGTVWENAPPLAVCLDGTRGVAAAAAATPDLGQRPLERLNGGRELTLGRPLTLDPERLAERVEPAAAVPSGVLADAAIEPALWRYTDFPRAARPLRVAAVTSRPAPRQPAANLVDGHITSSRGSCMFPVGAPVEIDLDLGSVSRVREVRVRAWEMNDGWQTTNRAVWVSVDGRTWDRVPGEPLVIGTQRWGSNVNTIYGIDLEQDVRFVRYSVEPANPEARVYLAEIEIIGEEEGALPSLTTVLTADLDGDGQAEVVVGTEAGHVVALDRQGRELWRVDVEARLTVLAAIDVAGDGRCSVIYGASQDLLGLIGPDGTKIREIRMPQYRGIASEPQNITVADLDGDGTPSIVVGVRSWMYLAYTPQLELEWQNVIYAHSATVAEVADLDGDGKLEVVAGNAYFRMNIINSDGTRRINAGRFGPEQTAVTSADLDGDGRREVILGTDGGDVLAFDLEGNQLWERNVGDRVTSLLPVRIDGAIALLAASESGFVWAIDRNGAGIWSRNLGEPVRRMLPVDGAVMCAASGVGVVTISHNGAVVAVSPTEAPALDLAIQRGTCAAILADGSACGVPVSGTR